MATNKRKTNGNPRGRPPKKARLTGVAKVGYQYLGHKDRAERNKNLVHTFTSKTLCDSMNNHRPKNLRSYWTEKAVKRSNNIKLSSVRRLDGIKLTNDFKILPIIKRKLNDDECFHKYINMCYYEKEGVNCSICEGVGKSERHADVGEIRSRDYSTRTFYFLLKGEDVDFKIVLNTHSRRDTKGEINDYDTIETYKLKEGMGIIFPSKLQHWANSKEKRCFVLFSFLVKEKVC